MFQELALQGMQFLTIGHTFYRIDLAPFGFRSQHHAGADQPVINRYRTGTAITRATALLGAGQAKPVAQYIQQGFIRFT